MKQYLIIILLVLSFTLSTILALDCSTVYADHAYQMSVFSVETLSATGSTRINGNIAIYNGDKLIGFPPSIITGSRFINNEFSTSVRNSIQSLHDYLSLQNCTIVIDQNSPFPATVTPGVICIEGSATLPSNLQLSGMGLYLFKIANNMISNAPKLTLSGGARPCDVFWFVGQSVTINDGSLSGILLAIGDVTMNNHYWNGRIFSYTSSVTLNSVTVKPCAADGSNSICGIAHFVPVQMSDYSVEFLTNAYAYDKATNTTSFSWRVTVNKGVPAMNQWYLGTQPELEVVDSIPNIKHWSWDAITGITGLKWNHAVPPGKQMIFSMIVKGNVGVAMVPYSMKGGSKYTIYTVKGPGYYVSSLKLACKCSA